MLNHFLFPLFWLKSGLRRWTAQRLVFLFPVLCLAASLAFFGESAWFQLNAKRTQGEVVQVYEWKNDSWVYGGDKVYGPVFRYTWSDGKPTRASTGQSFSHRFTEGERHTILFDPSQKGDVRLTWFEQLWAVPSTLLALALASLLVAWPLWLFVIRPRIKRENERRLFSLPGRDHDH